MPTKELKQAWLMVFAGLTGGVMGAWVNSFSNEITLSKVVLFFLSLFGVVLLLEVAIRHNS